MERIKYAIKNSKGLYLRAGSPFNNPDFGVLSYAFLSTSNVYAMMLIDNLGLHDCKVVKIRIEEEED